MKYASMLELPELADRFEAVRRYNLWGADETPSGPGSTLAYTRELRPRLLDLLKRHQIQRLVDAPCGDLNWIADVVRRSGVQYFGFDIAPGIVERAQRQADLVGTIKVGDIRSTRLPRADLWICRDCWFHLSFDDIFASLRNFIDSDIPLALLTSHVNENGFKNRDIVSGDFRLMDLFAEPFDFPAGYIEAIDDWIPPWPKRRLYLWSREQLAKCANRLDHRVERQR